jgi:hypothetical protein
MATSIEGMDESQLIKAPRVETPPPGAKRFGVDSLGGADASFMLPCEVAATDD